MKQKILFVILATAILLLLAVSSFAAVRPNVVISDFNIKEGSINVGKEFTLQLTLTNLEAPCADSITTTVLVNPPFSVKGVSTIPSSDTICGGQKTTIEVPMKIDPTATGGTYQLVVTTNYDSVTSAQFSTTSTINLFVNGTADIKASIVNSNPLDIYSGDTATITVNFENDGSFMAQTVDAMLTSDAPIIVKSSNSYGVIGTLNSKQSKTLDFSIEVPKSAVANDYNMNMKVSYLDENSNLVVKNFNFVLHVQKKALFSVSDLGTDKLYPNDSGKTARITVKNTGTDTAYKMKIKILPMYPFSTDGSVRYVDSLAPGNDASSQFTLNIDKDGKPGIYALDVLVEFEDADGKKFQDTTVASFTISEKTTFQKVVMDYIAGWILLAVVLFFIVIRRAGHKKDNSDENGNGKKVITVVSKHK